MLPIKRYRMAKCMSLGAVYAMGLMAYNRPSLAQDAVPTTEAIITALNPATSAQTRGLQITPGRPETEPSINLTVNFDFNSTKLDNETLLTLKRLGSALKDPRLRPYKFQIAGHTDAKGTDAYNQALSERRAGAVRDHLVFFYDVAPERLKAAGYGKTRLLNPSDPLSGVNRRVQIINEGPTS